MVHAGGGSVDVTDVLSNGRASYIVIQRLVAGLIGLRGHSESADSDLIDDHGAGYEVKAFKEAELHPQPSADWFHTAASSTFSANNHGPAIKKMLADDRYDDALRLCHETGYAKNDYYLYTNTASWDLSVPLRFIIVPTATVLANLSSEDPRLISRRTLDRLAQRTERLTV